ncbi:MAG: hypothetical protein GXP45_04150 [bacterium]|nr:hypothetical protein [bacterium]
MLKLQEKEKKINQLYQIFSKDLLLLALEDSLPTLNDIINSFLAQVVSYQIHFFLERKNNNEKMELQAQIYDEKGERDVKSLS